jgi:hypothetical protein
MNWNNLGWTVLVCLALLLPARFVGAACMTAPSTVTLLDERGVDTPVSFVCDGPNVDGVCSPGGMDGELPQCPIVILFPTNESGSPLGGHIDQLRVATGKPSLFWAATNEEGGWCLDCGALRMALVEAGKEMPAQSPCNAREKILFNPKASQYAQPGDLAYSLPTCGGKRYSALASSGEAPQVKLANYPTPRIGAFDLARTATGESCCDLPAFDYEWLFMVEDPAACFESRSLIFKVGEESWTARPGEAHMFPGSGVAISFRHWVAPQPDNQCENEDFDGDFDPSVMVFASAYEGFQEVTTEGEWCAEWCAAGEGADVQTDSAADAQPDAVITADPGPSNASSGSSCNLGPNPSAAPWPLALLLAFLLVVRRARWRNPVN